MASPHVRPITIPGGFTVWTASDLHGQHRTVVGLLEDAGLCGPDGRWRAAPGTALVVCGDMVDRGPDSLGLVRTLDRLRTEAAEAGGLVVLLEGNHEAQVLGGLGAEPEIFRAFMAFGGAATLASIGLAPDEWGPDRRPEDIARLAAELAPDFVPLLWSFAPYARWDDVLFVHAGPFPGAVSLEDFEAHAARIWIRAGFYDSPDEFPDAGPWAAYRDAGIRRVVFGHSPVPEPTLYHGGSALNVDTWRGGVVTLARLEPGAPFASATFLRRPAEPRAVADAPVSAEEIRAIDARLPGVVDAWVARVHAR